MDWAVEMPLLTSRFFLYDFLKLFVILAIVVCILIPAGFALSGSAKSIVPLLEMFGWISLGIAYMFALIAWIIFRNRYQIGFRIDEGGIAWISLSRTARIANRLALVSGAVGGNLGSAGAGLLAMSAETGRIEWDKIRRVKYYPEEYVLSVMNSWRVVVRLFCTPENYSQVAQLVDSYVGGVAAASRQAGGR